MENKKNILKGGQWTMLSNIVSSVVQILRLSILTYFLTPNDFGLVAILNVVLNLVLVFGDLGLGSAIMSENIIDEITFNSLFWLQLIIFVLIYFILILFGGLLSDYFNNIELSNLLPLSLAGLIFIGIGKLYETILQKELLFKQIAIRNIISNIISLLFSVGFAYNGYGVLSLVISQLVQLLIIHIWNFITGQKYFRTQFSFSFIKSKELLRIGVFQTLTRVFDYFSSKLDVILIGKFISMDSLGLYDIAKQSVFRFIDLINNVVTFVLLPVIAKNKSNLSFIKIIYLKIIDYMSFILFSFSLLIILFSDLLVKILFNINFIKITDVIIIFALFSFINFLGKLNDILAIGFGKTKLSFYMTVFRLFFSPIIILLSVKYGIEGIAFGQLFLGIILAIIAKFIIVNKILNITFSEIFKSFYPNFSMSFIVFCLVLPVGYYLGRISIAYISITLLILLISYYFFYYMSLKIKIKEIKILINEIK